ncbi:hypothetical protein [Sphingobium yanoikuyae]|uniref:hypothetical protein n=1 Tax=Sphingobium yanoikuyae TaxID=13690 RepID=UPI00242DB797|nr:hypothetical protein [Sphingobium yanoikuyae]
MASIRNRQTSKGHGLALVAVPAQPPSQAQAFSAKRAILTHFGSVGLLLTRGAVADVEWHGASDTQTVRYRTSAGAEFHVRLPIGIAVASGEVLVVRSLTLPDGAVQPLMVRVADRPDWVVIGDIDQIMDGYAAGARRFVRWSAGAGSALAMLALCGVAPPLAATAAAASLAGAWGMRRRDRRDRVRLGRWLNR